MEVAPEKGEEEVTKPSVRMFKVGETVRWGSQAGGYHLTKQGKVVLIVPPNTNPYQLSWSTFTELHKKYDTHAIDPGTLARKYTSYIIEVPAKGKGRPKLYWPLPSQLELVDG